VLFGGRKIPEVMRGLGQGIREFKEGMRGDTAANPPASTTTTTPSATTNPPSTPEQKP